MSVVAIDPENTEQVISLIALFSDAHGWAPIPSDVAADALLAYRAEQMKVALHAFANPKPAEPQKAGTVIEVGTDELWARTAWATWHCLTDADARPRLWRDFPSVVRVIAGVTP